MATVSSVIDAIISAIDCTPHLADLLRVHVPVVARLRRFLQDGVGLGEPVHAHGRLHGAAGGNAGNLGGAEPAARSRLGQLHDAEAGGQADHAAGGARRQRRQRVAQLHAQFRQHDRTDERRPGPPTGRSTRPPPARRRRRRAAAVRHVARAGLGADDDQPERHLPIERGLCGAAPRELPARARRRPMRRRARRSVRSMPRIISL